MKNVRFYIVLYSMADINNCINYGMGKNDRGWEADDD